MDAALKQFAAEFDRALAEYLPAEEPISRLAEAMRYSALAPGKRLRPYLLVQSGVAAGGAPAELMLAAAAVECVHVFSLIHDDLPAMDDDDLRRGRPTSHKVFGEALAILAGDALLALAFELLTRDAAAGAGCDRARPAGAAGTMVRESAAAAMVRELAAAAGAAGMIGGQAADLAGERLPPDLALVESIHARKTARLIEAACRLGGLGAGASPEIVETLGRYGRFLGRAFQITDDLLDVTASREAAGKAVGKDEESGKQTYPRCVGIAESRRVASKLAALAVDALAEFDERADPLRALATFVVHRDR